MLTGHSQDQLNRRIAAGAKAIEASGTVGEDFNAKDAISNILTALFGPAGKWSERDEKGRGKVELDSNAVEDASALIDAALQSYFGDAEDYVEDEPLGDCEECGQHGVDTVAKGADGRSVCDDCREKEEEPAPAFLLIGTLVAEVAPLTDVVVLRDPAFSNEISVFGGEANVIDIDVGADDLRNDDQWSDWVESREADFNQAATKDAQALIAEIVSNYAYNFGHTVPDWATQ